MQGKGRRNMHVLAGASSACYRTRRELGSPAGAPRAAPRRPRLALLPGAAGGPLGDDALPVPEARAIMGEELLVGRTVRSADGARAALAAGADHRRHGPVVTRLTQV